MNLLKTYLNQKLNEEILYGEGSYLITKKNRYLDLTGGLTGHAILGWTNPTVDREIIKQLKKIPHVDYKNYYSDIRDELASILISKKYGLSKVFFVGSSGAVVPTTPDFNIAMQGPAVCFKSSKCSKIVYIQIYHNA